MDLGNALSESFAYAKEGLVGKWLKWVLLIVLEILPSIPIIAWAVMFIGSMMNGTPDFPTVIGGFIIAFIIAILLGAFYQGFLLKILRGEKPLPEITNYGALFADGIKYVIIEIIYMIPVIIVLAAVAGASLMAAVAKGIAPQNLAAALFGPALVGIIIAGILAIILGLLALIGVIRFARMGKIGEAFNFAAILSTIGKIGWGGYILALIVLAVILVIVYVILGLIPIVGAIIEIIIGPFISIFAARYICQLYDSAGTV
ncbi:DUF4013 domain-containing protein [Methanoregula sp.]|uniref:DUF4013 domain-containing protein n=1 Tax=Methanoregula sp. TaxID=2052170 RepID=UPI002C54EB96|nr:DUF4013 domain-containing protein [Methanoregula sp.]HVP95995.1 DUF4013 domain-containing protein [Methanoregula sp.]